MDSRSGRKPFSILLDDPLTLVAIDVGQFTREIQHYLQAQRLISAAPMGNLFTSNLAKFLFWSREARPRSRLPIAVTLTMRSFLSVQNKERLYFLDECREVAESMWQPTMAAKVIPGGSPSALKPTWLTHQRTGFAMRFYNCGPEPMVHAAVAVEQQFASSTQIRSAIDYETKWVLGLRRLCNAGWLRLCVDGPFLNPPT